MRGETLVIVTAHNEGERIGATIAALELAFPGARVLLADDGSSDLTAEIARQRGARVIGRAQVMGKGAAATRAAREALREGAAQAGEDPAQVGEGAAQAGEDRGPIFILCDGDLGQSARALAALAQPIRAQDADVAVAAFAKRVGGGVGGALVVARWAIRRRCGYRALAPLSGQRALSARALEDVLPFAHGFGMEVGMTIDAVRAGHRVVEIELDLAHRASGRTPAGFAHRGRQLLDIMRAYCARR